MTVSTLPTQNPIHAPAVWIGAFVVAAVLYGATANRGVQWQDSGWQQLRIVTGQLEHPRGLALCHPLHHYLGRAAVKLTFLEPTFAITLISCTTAAVAIANVALALILLTRRLAPAAVATLALLLSHTFWQHATYTESYALTAALLSGEWLCLVYFVTTKKASYLALLALLNGLGVANHMLAALATPVDFALIFWALRSRRLPGRAAIAAGVLWLLGTLPYSLLVTGSMLGTHDVWGTLRSALVGAYGPDVLNVRLGARTLLLSAGYMAYNFPGLTVPLALVALLRRTLVPKPAKYVLSAQLVLYLLFALRYSIADQYDFFFATYMLLAIFAGVGLASLPTARLIGSLRRAVLVVAVITAAWTPAVYLAAARVLAARGLFAAMVQNRPYRDGYRAFFVPWGLGADCASKLNDAVRELAGSDGLILVADHMQIFGLRYAQTVGHLPDTVTILAVSQPASDELLAERRVLLDEYRTSGRPVVLVPRDRDHPTDSIPPAQWQRHGDIYRLITLEPPATRPVGTPG